MTMVDGGDVGKCVRGPRRSENRATTLTFFR
jgi:hypothetical protein